MPSSIHANTASLNVRLGLTSAEELGAFQEQVKSGGDHLYAAPNKDGSFTLYARAPEKPATGTEQKKTESRSALDQREAQLARDLIKEIVVRRLPFHQFQASAPALERRIDEASSVEELRGTLEELKSLSTPQPATQHATGPALRRAVLRADVERQENRCEALRHEIVSTLEDVRSWRARDGAADRRELAAGAVGSSISFTRFLDHKAITLAQTAAVGLSGTSVALSGVDAMLSGAAAVKADKRGAHWFALRGVGNPERATTLRDELKQYRGKAIDQRPPGRNDLRFALDPSGSTSGQSHVGALSREEQLDQLSRIGLYAAAKVERKATRKTVDSALSTLTFAFGAASLAAGVLTPPGALFGLLAMGCGIARGASKLVGWIKAASKAATGTLGVAREQNAKALLQLAISPDSKVSAEALKVLENLGVSRDALGAAKENHAKRREMIVTIMDLMRS